MPQRRIRVKHDVDRLRHLVGTLLEQLRIPHGAEMAVAERRDHVDRRPPPASRLCRPRVEVSRRQSDPGQVVDVSPIELAQPPAAKLDPPDVPGLLGPPLRLDTVGQDEPHGLIGPGRQLDAGNVAVEVARSRRVRAYGHITVEQRLHPYRTVEGLQRIGKGAFRLPDGDGAARLQVPHLDRRDRLRWAPEGALDGIGL